MIALIVGILSILVVCALSLFGIWPFDKNND